MGRRKLVSQLFPEFVLVTVLSLLLVSAVTIRSVRGFAMERWGEDLLRRAWAVERLVPSWLEAADGERLDGVCADLGGRMDTRITIIAPDGVVLGDSVEDSRRMDNHGGRDEIRGALAGDGGRSVRDSDTLGTTMMYQALPVRRDGELLAVVRLAVPLTAIEEQLRRISWTILAAVVIVSLLATAASYVLARRISLPLEVLRQGVRRFSRGRLDHRLPLGRTREIAQLAEDMNAMAELLDDRIRTVEQQRNELEAVFADMVEGVLLIDRDERVADLNRAAAMLLGTTVDEARGRPVPEVVRRTKLQDFLADAFAAEGPHEDDMVIRLNGQKVYLQVHGSRLTGSDGTSPRLLVVLNDVTRLRRLEKVRRDFVANVSHELKTPVTSIKGFVEALRDGALDSPDDARRFLDIIARQSDRLHAIIEDLLCLSRLEQGTGETRRELGVYPVAEVLEAAAQACQYQAEARGMNLRVRADTHLKAPLDPPLLEQAVVNLVTNAVKYSEQGDIIELTAERHDDRIHLCVIDHGRGIDEKHLPRLFERFYRVDKARSRQQGGTGLGLAIVKHIARFHGGDVTVVSEPGEGSTFTILLPLGRED